MSQDSCDDEIEQRARSVPQIEEAIQSDKSSIYKRMTFWNVVFNGILAVTTVLLGILAKSANDTSQESLRVSTASYQVSERAMKMAE
jgi:hypothetical protein